MQSQINQEIERRISATMPRLNQVVQQALTEMSGKPRPKTEADAKLRQGLEREFRDRNRAHGFYDELNKGLQRRHGPNANLRDAQLECERQFRRLLWRDAEARQDELVARLTAGQPNLNGGSHFPRSPGNPPIGWAIGNNAGATDVLVDKSGCPVQRFRLPMDYDGHRGPQLAPGQPFIGTNNVRRTYSPFNPTEFKKRILIFEGVKRANALGVLVGQSVDYMYMDTGLNVTVGFGHKISQLSDALSLKFIAVPPGDKTDVNSRTASTNEITLAHAKLLVAGKNAAAATKAVGITNKKQNKHASHFEPASIVPGDQGKPVQIRLPLSEGEILFYADVDRILGDTERSFRDFNSYPAAAQFGLLDMTFNVGIGNLQNTYLKFKGRGIEKRNWAYAAIESERYLDKARDDLIRDKFEEAARQEPFFHDPACTNRRRIDDWHVPGFFGT